MTATRARWISILPCLAALAACGGGGYDDPTTPNPPSQAGAFTVGGTVTGLVSTGLVLQNDAGIAFGIPGSGSFTFTTPLIPTGAPYSVTIKTQPSRGPAQHCTVANGSGTMGTAPVTNISVTCVTRVNRFVYVPNSGSGDVSAFAINPATGALSAVAGSPFPAAVTPRFAAVDGNGALLYVTNEGSDLSPPRISAYRLDATSGALSQIAGSPFDVSIPPPPSTQTPLARPLLHPSGSVMYVSGVTALRIYGFTIDAASGGLATLPSMPVGTGVGRGIFSADGNVLFLPHDSFGGGSDGAIAAYSVHQPSGVLTSIGAFPTGGRIPASLALSADGALLFAPNAGAGTIAVFRVDSASGTLTAAAGSPFDGGLDTIPTAVTVHPTRNFVYVTNSFVFSSPVTASLSAFRFDATTGVLTPIAGTPFSTNGLSSTAAQIEPSGKFLYVSNQVSANIQAYAIDQTTGVLTNVPGSPFATGEFPFPLQIDASGKYLYVAAFTSRTVSSYAIDATTGALTLVSSVQTGAGPSSVELVGLQ